MKVLLLGRNGQVGYELQRSLAPLGELISLARQDLDLTDKVEIRNIIRDIKPNLIVNAAAYTNVDRAEMEEEIAYKVNAEALECLVEEAQKFNTAIVHYSTDYVFDGEKDKPYREDDKPNPLNVYGRTKLAGENILKQSQVPYLILRTGWLYGAKGKNFLQSILQLAKEKELLEIVDDQVGTPNWCRFIAGVTAEILMQGKNNIADFLNQFGGIYHLTASGNTSWYDYARLIIKLDPARQEQICRRIVPIKSVEYPTPANRPKYSVLNNAKLEETFKLKMLGWESYLKEMMNDLSENGSFN